MKIAAEIVKSLNGVRYKVPISSAKPEDEEFQIVSLINFALTPTENLSDSIFEYVSPNATAVAFHIRPSPSGLVFVVTSCSGVPREVKLAAIVPISPILKEAAAKSYFTSASQLAWLKVTSVVFELVESPAGFQ